MKKYSGEEIIQGILNHNEKIIYYIYSENYRIIKQLVKTNNGTDEDADDIFQEAIMVIYRKIRDNNFNLYVAFGTYLYAVAKNIWQNELKRRSQKINTTDNFEEIQDGDNDIFVNLVKNEKHELVWHYFEKLSSDCQKVIKLFIEGKSIAEVTKIMKYSSEQHTKNRRLRCKNSLISQIINDPKFKELKDEKAQDINQSSRW
jgi:RNA polymerase sigma factor (sigma-70 family)